MTDVEGSAGCCGCLMLLLVTLALLVLGYVALSMLLGFAH